MNGTFIISLDFELHWGGFEKWALDKHDSVNHSKNSPVLDLHPSVSYNGYFLNTRHVIPHLLSMFEKYQVHVTWATVGMLLCESRNDLLDNAPKIKPTYKEQQLSAYNYIDKIGIGENETSDPFHYAPSLVKQILQTPHQELGTHTFAHYYCNEAGQTVEQFRADLQAAQRMAKQYGVRLQSLVFPRNQFNDQYLQVCFEEGITSVRSNPLDWFWNIESTQQESAWKRLNRGMDAYFPVGKQNTYDLNALRGRENYPICIPASRLLRPYNPNELLLNDLKISRIKTEMTRAAQRGEVYHLWWHPHNFGNYPEQNIMGLTKILQHYDECRKQWNMESKNMQEITAMINHVR